MGHDKIEKAVRPQAASHTLIQSCLLQQSLQHNRKRLHRWADCQRLHTEHKLEGFTK